MGSDELLLARGADAFAPINLRQIINAKALRLFEGLLQQAFVYDRVFDIGGAKMIRVFIFFFLIKQILTVGKRHLKLTNTLFQTPTE